MPDDREAILRRVKVLLEIEAMTLAWDAAWAAGSVELHGVDPECAKACQALIRQCRPKWCELVYRQFRQEMRDDA